MVIFYGTIIFCIAFSLHLAIWKIRLPKNQTKALLQIFLGTLSISLIVLWFTVPPITGLDYFHIALFFISLTLVYIITYVVLEIDSPSLVIVMNIAKAGQTGLKKDDLFFTMTDDFLVKPRIEDLVKAQMVYLERGKYKLRLRGTLFVSIFIFYRNLIKQGKGG